MFNSIDDIRRMRLTIIVNNKLHMLHDLFDN